jgi:CubicO group peptidase (beta-lactamase class C family)
MRHQRQRKVSRRSLARTLALLHVTLLTLAAAPSLYGQGVPGEVWQQYATPEEAGWTAEGIELAKVFADSIGTAAFMLVYDGAVVTTYGDVGRRYMCHSVRKSFLSALYGIHVAEGTIDVEKTLAELGINDKDALSETEKQATIHDMLKARSGVYHPAAYETASMAARRPPRGSHPPNTFWYYNNWDFNTLNTILEQETGTGIFEEFRTRIADPLQMQDYRVRDGYYHLEPEHSNHPAYPFRMSARDMARFGLLFLYEGRWGDRQLIPSSWVEASATSYSDVGDGRGYGYMWWTLPDSFAGGGAYSALGVGSQTITVLPVHNIVFVHRVDTYRGDRVSLGLILELVDRLLEATVGEAKLDPRLVPLPDPPPPARFVELPQAVLERYVGKYPFIPDNPLEMTLEEGILILDIPGAGQFGLHPLSEREFLIEDMRERLFIEIAEDGTRELIAEALLNEQGYAYLEQGDVERAIEIFKRNVQYFPESWNVYDSLAEAYEQAGDLERAIENYRRSVDLNPDNAGAVRALERLGARSP